VEAASTAVPGSTRDQAAKHPAIAVEEGNIRVPQARVGVFHAPPDGIKALVARAAASTAGLAVDSQAQGRAPVEAASAALLGSTRDQAVKHPAIAVVLASTRVPQARVGA
jgi:hypothetical protein